MTDLEQHVRYAITHRRSVRGGFLDQPVSREDLLDLVEAGAAAPSGSNWQDVRFVIVTDPDELERIGRIRRSWPYKSEGPDAGLLGRAKALIAVFIDTNVAQYWRRHNGRLWTRLESQSAAAAIQNILLLAFAKGLGSCWVSAFEEMRLKDCLCGGTWADVWAPYDLPDSYRIYGIVMLGHRADPSVGEVKHHGRPVERRPREEYVWSFDGERMCAG